MTDTIYTGGCQCGAVRFRVDGVLGDPHVCHCRMCQKAFGNFYAPLVSAPQDRLTWTRAAPKYFRSSNAAERGFCADCGTPLSYQAPDGIGLAIAAFDDPRAIVPTKQWGIEAKLPYVDRIAQLPGEDTMADQDATSFLADLVSYQHPDHETETWPPEDRR